MKYLDTVMYSGTQRCICRELDDGSKYYFEPISEKVFLYIDDEIDDVIKVLGIAKKTWGELNLVDVKKSERQMGHWVMEFEYLKQIPKPDGV